MPLFERLSSFFSITSQGRSCNPSRREGSDRSIRATHALLAALFVLLTGASQGCGGSSFPFNYQGSVAPRITVHPMRPIPVVEGNRVSLNVAASGTPTPTLQWERSADGTTWTDIPQATEATWTFTAARADHGASFRVRAANLQGSVTSDSVALEVHWAPAFTTQPASQAVTAPSAATFIVAVDGNPAAALQWQASPDGATWADLPGANSASLATGATSTGDSGRQFRCVATNAVSSANSDPATLTVNQPLVAPVFTLQPSSQTVSEWQPATFTVAASGNPAPSCTWEKSTDGGSSWTSISGATYSFTADAGDNGAQFRAKAANGVGTTTSNPATLTVQWAPVFTTQTTDQLVAAGQPATFTVAASGNPAPSCTWEKSTDGGSSWTSISGATFTFTAAAGDNGAQFRAKAANGVGTTTSAAATLYTITFTNNGPIPSGTAATLTAAFSTGTGRVMPGNQAITSGVGLSTGTLTETTTYTLTVTHASGVTATATTTVTVTAPTHVTLSGNAGVAGALVTYTGGSPIPVDATGAYSFTVPYDWSGTVEPSKAGYTFSPIHRTYANVIANQTAQDFTATAITPTISGNAGVAGATLSYTDGSAKTATSAADGSYSFTVAYDWSGTVTPSKVGYTFSPANRTYTNVIANQTGQDYIAGLSFLLPGNVPLDLVPIPGGTFQMGRYPGEVDTSVGEAPQHPVTISQAFYMATFETTQAQWAALMGSNPSHFQTPADLTRPVEQVSYLDITQANGFLERLNAATVATRPAGLVFRLPTEAEWEYAARAGTATRFYWGDDLDSAQIGTYAWYAGNSINLTHGTGDLKTPNAFGLYNMSGNVWEWCQDWFADYPSDAQTDPTGPASGTYRMSRGGDWTRSPGQCHSAIRSYIPPVYRGYGDGFRVVLARPLASGTVSFSIPDSSTPDPADGVSLDLVPIPAGTFQMGRYAGEVDSWQDEAPQHAVTISQDFYMATFETTQAQWQALMGSNPSEFTQANDPLLTNDLTRPVERVSYLEITQADGFLERLNAATAATRPAGLVFRLPTEAEWEYAVRGGTATRFYWGDDPGYAQIGAYAWFAYSNTVSTHGTGDVKRPNAFGLYNMVGNVCEWCQDLFGTYSSDAQTDPTGPATGNVGVLRGGHWNATPDTGRSAYRFSAGRDHSRQDWGFRVVLARP